MKNYICITQKCSKELTDLSRSEIITFMELAYYHNEDIGAFPSLKLLEADTGLSKRMVRYNLDSLTEKSFIKRDGRVHRSWRYRINVGEKGELLGKFPAEAKANESGKAYCHKETGKDSPVSGNGYCHKDSGNIEKESGNPVHVSGNPVQESGKAYCHYKLKTSKELIKTLKDKSKEKDFVSREKEARKNIPIELNETEGNCSSIADILQTGNTESLHPANSTKPPETEEATRTPGKPRPGLEKALMSTFISACRISRWDHAKRNAKELKDLGVGEDQLREELAKQDFDTDSILASLELPQSEMAKVG